MTRALPSIGIVTASLFLALSGCGGCGEQAPTSLPPTTTTPAAAGTPSTTLATQEGDEDAAAPLLVWAEAEPDEGKAPLTVELRADTEGGKPPLKYTWTFSDSAPDSSEVNPKHTFTKPGKYRVDLNVADASGDSDTDYVEVEVQ